MSYWPMTVRLRVVEEVDIDTSIEYEEFREWAGGISLYEASNQQIIDFLEAGDEFYKYDLEIGSQPELIARGENYD